MEKKHQDIGTRLASLTDKDWDDLQDVLGKVRRHEGPFASWPESKETEPGVQQFPYCVWSETLTLFQHTFCDKGLELDFDSDERDAGGAIFDSQGEDKFAGLDAQTVLKIFTAIIRADRFNDGALANFFTRGDGEKLLTRLLEFRPRANHT